MEAWSLAGILASFSRGLKQNDLEQTVNNEVFNKSRAGACQQVVYRFTASWRNCEPGQNQTKALVLFSQFLQVLVMLRQINKMYLSFLLKYKQLQVHFYLVIFAIKIHDVVL